jgi:hypothetical protein
VSNSNALVSSPATVIIGVDTHKFVHVAIDLVGARLASRSAPADRAGYAELVAWARTISIDCSS